MTATTRPRLRRAAPRQGTLGFWRRAQSPRESLLIGVVATVVLILVWHLVTLPGGLVKPLFLPSPTSVAERFLKMLTDPYLGATLWGHVWASLQVVLKAWALAGLVGVPIGVAIAWWKRARWLIWPLFQIIRPVAPLAWIPLTIVWFGIGESARISVVFIAALVPWVLNAIAAVESVDRLLIWASRTMGVPQHIILGRVVLRTALPTFIAGGRIALGNAWTTLVAAELVAATAGLGFVALNSSRNLDIDILLVSMLVIGLLGALFSWGLRMLARWAAPWTEAM